MNELSFVSVLHGGGGGVAQTGVRFKHSNRSGRGCQPALPGPREQHPLLKRVLKEGYRNQFYLGLRLS